MGRELFMFELLQYPERFVYYLMFLLLGASSVEEFHHEWVVLPIILLLLLLQLKVLEMVVQLGTEEIVFFGLSPMFWIKMILTCIIA